jgi:ADP-ribose pyrophosphatase YjhB (NUDIX family)
MNNIRRTAEMDTNAKVAVGTLIRTLQDTFLILKRTNGVWELPGGKLERGEVLSNAAKREVKEETGLDVTLGQLAGLYSSMDGSGETFIFAIFHAFIGTEQPVKLSKEHTAYKFVTVQELIDMSETNSNLAPRLRELVRDNFGHRAIFDRNIVD